MADLMRRAGRTTKFSFGQIPNMPRSNECTPTESSRTQLVQSHPSRMDLPTAAPPPSPTRFFRAIPRERISSKRTPRDEAFQTKPSQRQPLYNTDARCVEPGHGSSPVGHLKGLEWTGQGSGEEHA